MTLILSTLTIALIWSTSGIIIEDFSIRILRAGPRRGDFPIEEGPDVAIGNIPYNITDMALVIEHGITWTGEEAPLPLVTLKELATV